MSSICIANLGAVTDKSCDWYVAENTTPTYTGTLIAEFTSTNWLPVPIPGSELTALTLSIVDRNTQAIINNCNQVNILNTGRGTIDNNGNIVITLQTGDTSLSELLPNQYKVIRSLIIDWTYNAGTSFGRHEVDFTVVRLSGP